MSYIKTTMKNAANTYYGPNSSAYQQLGSVSANEEVYAIAAANNQTWVQIEYSVTGTTKKKRGYVAKSATNLSDATVSSMRQNSNKGTIAVKTGGTTYTGPNDKTFYSAGSVSTGESVTNLGYSENGYTLIEYSVSNTSYKKCAYYLTANLNISSGGDTGGGTGGSTGSMANYKTYKQYAYIPSSLPMGGALVSQGFNDKSTNHKGHLGYDLCNITYAKPLFKGTVVGTKTTNSGGNGRTVCVKHTVGNTTFYTTYCHLASVLVSNGATVTTSTNLGKVGGSGYNQENAYATHVHVCAYTGSAQTDPYGYCVSGGTKSFEDTTSYANAYYYGPDTSKFPRCGGVCFYDPYGVVTSNAGVIVAHHP